MIDVKRRDDQSGRKRQPHAPPGSDGAAEVDAIWAFDHKGRWKRVRVPLPQWWGGDRYEVEDQADRDGFFRLADFGPRNGRVEIEVFGEFRSEKFIAHVWLDDEGQRVFLDSWPALFTFLCQAGPLLSWAEGAK